MITFMEWVSAVETMNHIIEQCLTEARSLGQPSDFNSLARMVVLGIQQTIAKGNFSTAIKTAASQMADAPELEPSLLGGKMRGRLKAISPNDQEDVVQNAIFTFIRRMPDMVAKTHFAADEEIDPDDLGSYFAANFHTALDWSKQTFFRKQGSLHKTVTDIAGDDEGQRPEASYEDDDEPTKAGMGVNRSGWNKAIQVVMSAEENLRKKIHTIQNTPKTRLSTTQLEGRAAMLQTTLAIMRNLPAQMSDQLGGGGGEDMTKDRIVGDNQIYDRLKRMVTDPDSELSRHDRQLLGSWASTRGGSDHDHREIIATALWIADGAVDDMKPKKAVDDKHWFYDFARFADGEGPEPEPEAPDAKPFNEPEPEEQEPEPEYKIPVKKPRKPKPVQADRPKQPTLFDDE